MGAAVRQHRVVRVGCLLGTSTIGTAIADPAQAHKRDNDTTNGSQVGNLASALPFTNINT